MPGKVGVGVEESAHTGELENLKTVILSTVNEKQVCVNYVITARWEGVWGWRCIRSMETNEIKCHSSPSKFHGQKSLNIKETLNK